jgi:hypothetical protein
VSQRLMSTLLFLVGLRRLQALFVARSPPGRDRMVCPDPGGPRSLPLWIVPRRAVQPRHGARRPLDPCLSHAIERAGRNRAV